MRCRTPVPNSPERFTPCIAADEVLANQYFDTAARFGVPSVTELEMKATERELAIANVVRGLHRVQPLHALWQGWLSLSGRPTPASRSLLGMVTQRRWAYHQPSPFRTSGPPLSGMDRQPPAAGRHHRRDGVGIHPSGRSHTPRGCPHCSIGNHDRTAPRTSPAPAAFFMSFPQQVINAEG